jgi:hypothetical protein
MGKAKDNGMSASPADIRTAIADTRDELGQHLSVLGNQFFSPKGADGPKETTMPTEKRAKPPTQSGGESRDSSKSGRATVKGQNPGKADAKDTKKSTSTKKTVASKPGSAGRSTTTRKVKGVAAKAGQVLDTMMAGAVVGAVKAAAQAVADKEALNGLEGAGKKGHAMARSTGEVLGEMAPGAAVGAVVGAAKAVMPETGEAKKKPTR